MTVAVGTEEYAANLALGHIGEPEIAAMADLTKRARAIRTFFAAARDNMLREKDWNFAQSWHLPAADPVAGLGDFKIRFPLPAYCVRVRSVLDADNDSWGVESAVADVGGVPVQSMVLVTNITAPTVNITRNDIPVRMWDAVFLMAFSHELASLIATKLGRSQTTSERHARIAREKVATAATVDSKEASRTAKRPETSWSAARRGRYRSSSRHLR